MAKSANQKIPVAQIPVLPLRNTLLFPGQVIPVVVGRSRSVSAVERATQGEGWLFVVAQKHEVVDRDPRPDDLYRLGVLARIENRVGGEGGKGFQLLLAGVKRFHVDQWVEAEGMLLADGQVLDDVMDAPVETIDNLVRNARQLVSEIVRFMPPAVAQFSAALDKIEEPGLLANTIAQNLDLKTDKKQELLETAALKARFLALLEVMTRLRDELQLQHEVQKKVSGKLGKQQREALLREQIRALQDELGEGRSAVMKEYMDKITQAKMPEEAEKVALEQLARLESLNAASPETHVIRNHLDLLVAMPWSESAASALDLERAKAILERDHFGLEKIKKRILEHLAVMKLKPDKKGSILLFVGPPGVGKTSLAKSIAEALERPYVRVSLGGVRDDAEIRGHRRTYVGAMPGRIVDGIKRAGKNNPVFVLDEIDKLGRGFTGDPAGALLEVLDPEQNARFLDHFLDVPFDLSKVFFVCTANTVESIPAPLLDRMEVITLTGYTTAEKMDIAQRHLVPKQLSEHGITAEQIVIPEDVLREVTIGYTREAGVRELQRKIAALVRAQAQRILGGGALPIVLSIKDVDEALGGVKFRYELAEKKPIAGVVAGLAWTPVGGDILFIESQAMPGKGQLVVTGQLGDVMKESAQIAWSHVRARVSPLMPNLNIEKIDVHLHVPAGAIPKDGPSAGSAMLVSLASLFLQKAPPVDLGMTGEITLRGTVMPVGGIKEKLVAAHRSGLKRILLPRDNERDLRDVPELVKKDLKIILVDTVEDVLREALSWTLPAPTLPPGFDTPHNFA